MIRARITHGGSWDKEPPSERGVEVLALAARGMSNRQIAVVLILSEATVKCHLSNAYEKHAHH